MRVPNIQVPPVGMRVPITPKDLVAPDSVPRKKPQEESKGELDMNVQDELKALKERIVELEEQAKDELFPQEGDDYCYTTMLGRVCHGSWDNLNSETSMLELGNIYRTEEEAEFDVEKKKVEAELRKFSRPFKEDEYNYFIQIHPSHNNIVVESDDFYQTQGTIYFESTTIANEATDTVGAERIKKYLFGVEEQ